jgi:hypothetical protein
MDFINMNQIEYVFRNGDQVHVLQTKPSANSKLGAGYIVGTYHFSIDQVLSVSLTLDAKTCFSCPYSYNMNGGKSGGCYTHKGLIYSGLRSMLRRLNRLYNDNKIQPLDKTKLNNYLLASKTCNPILTRFGNFGEPVLLELRLVGKLARLSNKSSGYTHLWGRPEVKGYSKYLMASVHSSIEAHVAKDLGWRSFIIKDKSAKVSGAICPAAKEFAGNKKTCVECGACNGTFTGRTNNIIINKH